jgi:hypothetical protein
MKLYGLSFGLYPRRAELSPAGTVPIWTQAKVR